LCEIITRNGTWCFQHDTEIKRKVYNVNNRHIHDPKKARISNHKAQR